MSYRIAAVVVGKSSLIRTTTATRTRVVASTLLRQQQYPSVVASGVHEYSHPTTALPLSFSSFVATPIREMSTATADAAVDFPVKRSIEEKLRQALEPTHLEVINESYMHKVPKNSETHFKVVVVSPKFDTIKNPVQRHRLVNDALREQLDGPVHALSIVTKSPSQWQAMLDQGQKIHPSPKCSGGDGSIPHDRS